MCGVRQLTAICLVGGLVGCESIVGITDRDVWVGPLGGAASSDGGAGGEAATGGMAGAGGLGGAPVHPCEPDFVASSYADAVLADAPIGYWRLDDADTGSSTQTVLNEVSGPHGSARNLQLEVEGAFANAGNTAAAFVSAAQSLLVIGPSYNLSAGSFTVELWAKPEELVESEYHFVAAEEQVAQRTGFELYFTTQNTTALFYVNDMVVGSAQTAPPVVGSWTHLVLTHDHTSRNVQLYVNGLEAADGVVSAEIANAGELTFGGPNSFSASYSGDLDEIAIYDVPLSCERVRAHYLAAEASR